MVRTPSKREVTNVVPSSEVTQMMLCDTSQMAIEVRRHLDGHYSIWYPEEGWISCPPVCELKHKHAIQHPHVESFYKPTDLEDALEYAESLAYGREVKVVHLTKTVGKKKEVEDE